MTLTAIGPYEFEPSDGVANFHGARLIYAGWNEHLLFSCPYAWPLPPDLPFAHFVQGPMAEAFGQHPDWPRIDWSAAIWTRNGEPFVPAMDRTIDENGLAHKDALRFTTPGLAGLDGKGF